MFLDTKLNYLKEQNFFSDLLNKNITSSGKIKEISEEYFLQKKDINPIFVIKKGEIQTK